MKIEVKTCRDCGVSEGSLHVLGCFQEECPFCGRQLASCGCLEEHIDVSKYPEEGDCYPIAVDRKWAAILKKKGRSPFIYYPNVCSRCGAVSPEFFRVSDSVWKKYVQLSMRSTVICKACFGFIKTVTDKGGASNKKRNG